MRHYQIVSALLLLYLSSSSCSATILSPPTNTTLRQAGASIRGYYQKTWRPVSPLPGANVGVAFSGWADVNNAISESSRVYGGLVGAKYISFGGGNANGELTAASLGAINAAITSGRLSGYVGIVYDVEVGPAGLAGAYEQSFAIAKSRGFKVLVTVSHSAPYGIPDAHALMDSFFRSGNIDYISPQLYTTGAEPANDYAITGGYGWNNYVRSRAAIVVSIVRASYYQDAWNYFRNNHGITVQGYIQWADN